MAAKLSAHDLLAAAAELAPEERRTLVARIRAEPEVTAASEDETLAEVTMASAARMFGSSREVLERALQSAARVNDELARGWF